MSTDTPRTVLKSVAGWTLGQTLGRGGFGHVRKATHNIAKRDCAVKILPSLDFGTLIQRDDLLDAMEAQKEVVLLKVFGGLGMKGIVSLDLVKEKGGWKYLFLPLIPGVTSNLICPLDKHTVIPLFRGLLCNLHSLHSIGIIHEDLKPANILMDEDGYPILADFGFATFSPQASKKIGGGGTLDFLSPEKVQGNPYRGPPSDVWACGILLYKLLTDKHPYILDKKNDSDEIIERRICEFPPDLSAMDQPKIRAKYPDIESARDLIMAVLHPNPKARATIPWMLAHPFLNPSDMDRGDLEQLNVPVMSNKPVETPRLDILDEIKFLAHTAGEWHMCQTDQRLKEKLVEAEDSPRWEKRMYHALEAWQAKDPDDVGLREGEVSVRSERKPRMKSLERVMSQMDMSIAGPSKPMNPGTPVGKKRLSTDLPRHGSVNKNEDSVLADATKKHVNQPRIQDQAPEIEIKAEEPFKKPAAKKPQAPPKKATLKVKAGPAKRTATQARSKAPIASDHEGDENENQEEGLDNDEDEFLPAPLPPVGMKLRRSPRLAGKGPEVAGLAYEGKVRRTKPGQ